MWKTINGFDNKYEISSDGQVRNKNTGKLLTIDYSNRSGYARVTLYYNNTKTRYLLHRLVMECFVGKSSKEVNHIDGNKKNNSLSNLEYVTRIENERHSRLYGSKMKFYRPFKVVFTDGSYKIYETKLECANDFGVTSCCVKQWLHCITHGYLNHGIVSINYIN